MRRLSKNHVAQMGMVGAAVGLLITLIISVLIYYNISASSVTTYNNGGKGTFYQRQMANASYNASRSVDTQAATFFTIAPIVAIVIVAVVVIGYVQRIGG